jgi:hypothetical protein
MCETFDKKNVYPLPGGLAETKTLVKIERGGLLTRIKNVPPPKRGAAKKVE